MDVSAITNNQILDWLERNNRLFPDKVFIHSIDQGKSVTYAQTYRFCRQVGEYLQNEGFKANDRVALLSNNSIEHLLVYFAVMAYGATICTIHVEMNAVYFGDILSDVDPNLVLIEKGVDLDLGDVGKSIKITPLGNWEPDGGDGFFALLPEDDGGGLSNPVNGPDDVATIFYTSGTTSTPKGVMCSFDQLGENTLSVMEGFGVTSDDRMMEYRSFNWLSAQILSATGPLSKGATLLLARKFSSSKFFDWVKEFKATIATGNPTIINMLLNRPAEITGADVPHFRFITSSSAPLLVQDWKNFEEKFQISVAQGYGASEAGWLAASNEKNRRFGSVGKPLPYHKIRIVDEEGNVQPANTTGRIELGRGPETAYRYIGSEKAAQVNDAGVIQTGDVGHLDDEGFLFVTGREKDLIIRGGVNISPLEIENIISELSDVSEAAAIGVADKIYGEEIVLFVVPSSSSEISEKLIREHCQQRLNKVKIPKYIEIREELPKTNRGKMDRKSLQELWSPGAG